MDMEQEVCNIKKVHIKIFLIRMSHWHHTMVDGAKFWISYQRLTVLSISSHWELIQNSAPSTIMWGQCDIQMRYVSLENNLFGTYQ